MNLRFISNRLPKIQNLMSVYAVIVFITYTWTTYTFIRYLPYWLSFLNVSEISAIFSYAILSDFFESLGVMCLLLGFCVVLPAEFLRKAFLVHGTLIVICLLGAIIVYLNYYARIVSPTLFLVVLWSLIILVASIIVSFVSAKNRFVVLAIEWLSNNVVIFLYIYIPMTILSLVNVLFRNL